MKKLFLTSLISSLLTVLVVYAAYQNGIDISQFTIGAEISDASIVNNLEAEGPLDEDEDGTGNVTTSLGSGDTYLDIAVDGDQNGVSMAEEIIVRKIDTGTTISSVDLNAKFISLFLMQAKRQCETLETGVWDDVEKDCDIDTGTEGNADPRDDGFGASSCTQYKYAKTCTEDLSYLGDCTWNNQSNTCEDPAVALEITAIDIDSTNVYLNGVSTSLEVDPASTYSVTVTTNTSPSSSCQVTKDGFNYASLTSSGNTHSGAGITFDDPASTYRIYCPDNATYDQVIIPLAINSPAAAFCESCYHGSLYFTTSVAAGTGAHPPANENLLLNLPASPAQANMFFGTTEGTANGVTKVGSYSFPHIGLKNGNAQYVLSSDIPKSAGGAVRAVLMIYKSGSNCYLSHTSDTGTQSGQTINSSRVISGTWTHDDCLNAAADIYQVSPASVTEIVLSATNSRYVLGTPQ